MTETTEEKAQQMAERYHSTDFKDLKIKSLEAQVSSLTKERDTYKINLQGVSKHNKQLKARIKELEAQLNNEWKDIKDAPRDGTEILIEDDGEVIIAFWEPEGWVSNAIGRYDTAWDRHFLLYPTIWWPLPTPPTPQEGGKE